MRYKKRNANLLSEKCIFQLESAQLGSHFFVCSYFLLIFAKSSMILLALFCNSEVSDISNMT